MKTPVIAFFIIFIGLYFTFANLDFQRNSNMKYTEFESLRSANQNSLIEIKDKYDEYETITSGEMLENWLINFCNNNSMDYDDIKISILQMEEDPVPLYLAYIEGYKNSYIILNKEAVTSFYSGAMLIEKDE